MSVLENDIRRTAEQEHIVETSITTKGNLIINAYAGTGKTSTLEMIERAMPRQPILYLVFNKKNAEEAVERMFSTTTVKTINSFGHGILAKAVSGKLNLKSRSGLGKKCNDIFRDMIDEVKSKETKDHMWSVYWEVMSAVGLAKALGYIPEGKYTHARRLTTQTEFHAALEEKPDDFVSDLIDAVLTRSIKLAYDGLIDFNDQIYMPALFLGTFPNFPTIFLDETQDQSPVNHAMLDKMKRSRLIAVGDPAQNIYAFRGAKPNGMTELKQKFDMEEMDLSISFRCPEAVVKAAQWRVPKFKWFREGGHVESLTKLAACDINDGAAIISRNNAPLFRMALQLLMARRSVSVAGSDIGPKVIGLMKRLGDEDMSKASLLMAIDDWLAERLAKESTTAVDLAECMRVFANQGNSLGQAIQYAEYLFAQKGEIKLLTGHKAKGLEFDTVYHLDPFLCRDDDQDNNLRYVITTRSADCLFEIDGRNIEW